MARDLSYGTHNYGEQGGVRDVIAGSLDVVSGGDLDVESGGFLKIQGVKQPAGITFAAAAGAANIAEVTCTVVDGAGTAIAAVFQLDLWLSDAATGAGHTGTAASGTVTAKSASGLVVDTQVAKKALRIQTLANGTFVLEITDTGKTGYYVCAALPHSGRAAVSTQLVTGDYGA